MSYCNVSAIYTVFHMFWVIVTRLVIIIIVQCIFFVMHFSKTQSVTVKLKHKKNNTIIQNNFK